MAKINKFLKKYQDEMKILRTATNICSILNPPETAGTTVISFIHFEAFTLVAVILQGILGATDDLFLNKQRNKKTMTVITI